MIPRPPLPPGPFLVVGLARSGVAAALALRARGAEVAGVRRRARWRPRSRERLRPPASTCTRRTTGVDAAARAPARVVKSPGVPQEAPVIAAARERGIPVRRRARDRLAAAARARVHRGHGLQRQDDDGRADRPRPPRGRRCRSRSPGNVGTALSGLPGTLAPGTIVVAEASSFQLEDTEAFAPEAAVLLNLAEDHLDRHGTFEAYRAAKLRGLRAPAERGRRGRAARPRRRGPRRLRAPRLLRRRPGRRARRPRRPAVVGRASR